MLLSELREDVGKGDYHPESFYAPIVAKFINDEGFAYWKDIYNYIENKVELTSADKTPPGKGQPPRWKKVVNNLHADRTLEGGRFGDIIRIKGGFATQAAANELGIDVLPDNARSVRNPGNRDPQYIKKKTGFVVNSAYTEMGKPKLRDITSTRNEIEHMIKMEPWLDDPELITRAKDIISKNLK